MSDLISRQDAIEAIEEIRSCIWEVDIPSPTVPEYIEHHKQMQELMNRCDTLRNNLVNLQSAEPVLHDEPYPYRQPVKNKWLKRIDIACPVLECPECECRVLATDYSYAVGNRGYSFCPYCGADLREEEKNEPL